ncbi:bacteriorhodopsin [Natrialba sp. PRR66]|uniref:bacteriorhodopsin n=1 Tax=Natrialba sp. PRR66 TaxID=3098146 RepID=UPI002B1E0807|nr:bacteriorhodopsin [Natrialba sp. PRR66]
MIEHTTTFTLTSAILAAMTVGFLVRTRRLAVNSRRYGYAVVGACAAMCVAYLLMAAELLTVTTTGREESIARFLGYSIAWGTVCYVLGAVSGADRRYTLAAFGAILTSLWATVASWILGGRAGTLVSLVIVAGVIALASVLYGPLAPGEKRTGSERTLLYTRLKKLTVLVFVGLLVTGMLSEQNLAFTDAFVGQTLATYLDIVWLAGFGSLVLESATTLGDTAPAASMNSPPPTAGDTTSNSDSAGDVPETIHPAE